MTCIPELLGVFCSKIAVREALKLSSSAAPLFLTFSISCKDAISVYTLENLWI